MYHGKIFWRTTSDQKTPYACTALQNFKNQSFQKELQIWLLSESIKLKCSFFPKKHLIYEIVLPAFFCLPYLLEVGLISSDLILQLRTKYKPG